MKNTTLPGNVLALALLSCTAMAADVHTLTATQTVPAPTPSTKDKTTCDTTVVSDDRGFALCAFLNPEGASSETTSYTIATEQPVTAARFIQVIN